jgi:hypothetical protein
MLTELPPTRFLKFETDPRGLRSNILFAAICASFAKFRREFSIDLSRV